MTPTQRTGKRQRYSDDDRVFALRWLDMRRGNVSLTARELEIPVPTLHQWHRGTRMWGMIDRASRRPLKCLYAFCGRKLPLLLRGEVVAIDLSALNGKEYARFIALLEKCRTPGESETKHTHSTTSK